MRCSVRKLLSGALTNLPLVKRRSGGDAGTEVRDLVFWALFYLYLWRWVDLRLIAHGAGIITNFPAFFTGWSYFKEFTSYPGGVIEYLGAFLSQFFYIGWAGPAIATIQAWLISRTAAYILSRFGLAALRWLRFSPAVILLAMYTQYTFHFISATALTVSLLFACLYLAITKTVQLQKTAQSALCLSIFAVLSLVLYSLTGGAYLVFAGIVALYEVLHGRRRIAVMYLLIGVVLAYVEGVLFFGERPANAYGNMLPYPWEKFALRGAEKGLFWAYVLYLFLPATLLLGVIWQMVDNWVRGRAAASAPRTKRAPLRLWAPLAQRCRSAPAAVKWAMALLAMVAAAAGVALACADRERKTLFEVDFYAYHRMWPQLLRAVRRRPDNIFVVHAVNLALYHTGRLGYDMLAYPQHPDALLLTAPEHIDEYWKKFDMYIELGHINLSENGLNESIERFGEQPLILKRLAMINMVKGRMKSAKVYLKALAKTMFHAEWARNYLALLAEDPNLATDIDVQPLRSVMVQKDRIASLTREEILLDLLEANPQNRMAFEYLMGLYLLTRNLDGLAEHYPLINNFKYEQLPRLYEEALLLYVARTRKILDLRGYESSGDLYPRFQAFNNVVKRYGGNKEAAFKELASLYGDSYFFYYLYGVSGIHE